MGTHTGLRRTPSPSADLHVRTQIITQRAIPNPNPQLPYLILFHSLFRVISLAIALTDKSVNDSPGLLRISLTQRLDNLSVDGFSEERGHGIPNLLTHESPSKLEV